MKKFGWLVLGMAVIGAFALTGCDDKKPQKSEMQPYLDGYAAIAQAEEITQKIEVKRGTLLVHDSQKTYTAQEDGYLCAVTTRTLNAADSGEEEAYKTETSTQTVARAETFAGKLKLEKSYLEAGYTAEENALSAKVLDGYLDDVLGMAEEHAEIRGATLSIALAEGKLTSLTVDYTSGKYSVHIVLQASY